MSLLVVSGVSVVISPIRAFIFSWVVILVFIDDDVDECDDWLDGVGLTLDLLDVDGGSHCLDVDGCGDGLDVDGCGDCRGLLAAVGTGRVVASRLAFGGSGKAVDVCRWFLNLFKMSRTANLVSSLTSVKRLELLLTYEVTFLLTSLLHICNRSPTRGIPSL